MANNPHLNEDNKNTRFSKDRQPSKNGRKPSIIKGIRKNENISISDIRIASSYILSMNLEQLKKILIDETKPFFWRVLIKAYMADFQKGKLDNTQIFLERIIGKSKEYIEHSGYIEVNDMSREELEQEFDQLMEKYNQEKAAEPIKE